MYRFVRSSPGSPSCFIMACEGEREADSEAWAWDGRVRKPVLTEAVPGANPGSGKHSGQSRGPAESPATRGEGSSSAVEPTLHVHSPGERRREPWRLRPPQPGEAGPLWQGQKPRAALSAMPGPFLSLRPWCPYWQASRRMEDF